MTQSPVAVVHACLKAYVDKDRAAIEALLDADYRFTSPIDNALDRATYLQRCWPNSKVTQDVTFIHEVQDGPRAFVIYEISTSAGRRFRNSEMHVVRAGRILVTEVYFGWDLPHKAPKGGFIENDGQGHA